MTEKGPLSPFRPNAIPLRDHQNGTKPRGACCAFVPGLKADQTDMRKEDQERIVTELVSRVCTAKQDQMDHNGLSFQELIEDSIYFERRRLKEDRGSPAQSADQQFWEGIQSSLRHSSEHDQRQLLRKSLRYYANEVSGNFDPRVYEIATRAMPPALGLLLNAVSPLRLVQNFPQMPQLEDSVVIKGEVEHLRQLHELGTVILVPTHISNLDSIIIGFALYRMGLPPFIYGAGLNLFTNPLISFFMRNLGAYTVDRKKRDPLYKDVLKEYATLTLENSYDNLFFPGGTRSRSGAIETKLKKGLLGTGLAAYINNLKKGSKQPNIYIVPCTLNFQLVLEAETLIDDFLKEVGKSRYIIDDDEFSRPKRVVEFMTQLMSLDSKIHVVVSRGLDPFGNPVDDAGQSLDPCGRHIDISRYVLRDGEPDHLYDRDSEYTAEVAKGISRAFLKDNVVESTHVTARALFNLLRRHNPETSLLRLLRTGGRDDDLPLRELYQEADRLIDYLRSQDQSGRIHLGPTANLSAEDVVSDALAHFSIYHTRPAAKRRGDRVVASDRNLLLFYQNRLEGYGCSGDLGEVLTPDHRAIKVGAR